MMNGLAFLLADQALQLANERTAEIRHEAELGRLFADGHRPSRLRQIAAAISARVDRLAAIDGNESLTPALSDYPYRA